MAGGSEGGQLCPFTGKREGAEAVQMPKAADVRILQDSFEGWEGRATARISGKRHGGGARHRRQGDWDVQHGDYSAEIGAGQFGDALHI